MILTILQVLGAIAVVAGVYVLLGLGWALVVGGVLLALAAVAAEVIAGPSLSQRRITRALRKGGS
jgi:hypothetical protein